MQKGPKLQRARWPVPFRPFTLINLTKKFFTGGGGAPSAPLNPPLKKYNKSCKQQVSMSKVKVFEM